MSEAFELESVLRDLRRGSPIRVVGSAQTASMLVLDGASATDIADWGRLPQARLVTTGRRASALGLETAASAVEVDWPAEPMRWIDISAANTVGPLPRVAADDVSHAAIALAKAARLMPVVALAADGGIGPAIAANDALDLHERSARRLVRIGDAAVPLADAEDTRIVAFRPGDGGADHLAVIIGHPGPDAPALVRLHSACLTGDLLGSLRCDCGDQLRGAVKAMSAAGGGIVLYLAQEGRDIGIGNKLRAYSLQDGGLDTLDANTHLGFEPDERDYAVAAEMLRQLGLSRVRLLTNNPDKVAQLARHGIAVMERVPHSFAANPHNRFYLATKAQRAGHLL